MQNYQNQVRLLLDVLPTVAREKVFALHGGTAINLFVRNMPRLSVDIDLTYLPLDEGNREIALKDIYDALERIKTDLEKKGLRVVHQSDKYKLQVSSQNAQIKVEVNSTGRGTLPAPQKMILCNRAQDEFDAFVEMNVVPFGQLYGGKICAALDRQHPRDLFDVKYLLENEGFSEDVKQGFILCLAGSGRPIHELVQPNRQDQRQVMENQFDGMTIDAFCYEDFERVREQLIEAIHARLTDLDKEFIMSVESGNPRWDIYNFADFPAVRWKLQNIEKLIANDAYKHLSQLKELEEKLRLQR
ncbi:MAG TPA: nucleotidyl transferase AbiEii/AbiGii toxin family protein [Methylotenera sp.]|nr:nucleotidyl transferase AbiEii/AbiGii toxin family protein [Methylotenera sp.]HPN01974.1 nucleotidyl transferase AbiEii/AbiGii toxin family protein [Methylotenera sp.]